MKSITKEKCKEINSILGLENFKNKLLYCTLTLKKLSEIVFNDYWWLEEKFEQNSLSCDKISPINKNIKKNTGLNFRIAANFITNYKYKIFIK